MTIMVIATRNPGKLAEFQEILVGLPVELRSLHDLGITQEIEETEETFEGNALLKARGYAALCGLPVLADDSGLEVAALNGRPGVYSARYGGTGLSDAERVAVLLKDLAGVPFHNRLARFVCVIALALPDGTTETVSGTVSGVIEEQPRGQHGFGYDPVFFVLDDGRTMAELPPERKHQLSHRGQAARHARAVIERWVAEGKLGHVQRPK